MENLKMSVGGLIEKAQIKEEELGDKNPEEDFESFKKELQTEENNALSSLENRKNTSRFKKAICTITAGLVLLTATPAFAQERGEKLNKKQEIELQIQKLEKQKMELEQKEYQTQRMERIKELNGYLSYFNTSGLALGEVKSSIRCPCEQFGVYLNGKHLGDIYSLHSSNTFSREKLINEVSKLLLKESWTESGLLKPQNPEAINAEVNTDPLAQKILKSWDGFVDLKTSTINIGGPDELTFDNKTKRIDIVGVGQNMLIITCENYDGKRTVVTCVDKIIKSIVEIFPDRK